MILLNDCDDVDQVYHNVSNYDDGEEEEYKIVGSMEADPFENKISNESPLGKAIIGKKQGEEIEVASPTGSYKIKIEKVD